MIRDKYVKKIKENLNELGYKNILGAPTIKKIVINMGTGKYKDDRNLLESAKKDISLISGQMPNFRRAKQSIAGFKLRAKDIVGISVTLRGEKMWSFFDKLISIVLPRMRDFRGLSRKSFDKHGNFTIGFAEHTVFPEIDPNKVDRVKSLEVTIVTSSKDDDGAYRLLKTLGMPFRD